MQDQCISVERKFIAWIFQAYGQIPPSPFKLVLWEGEAGEYILTYPPARHSLEERKAKKNTECYCTIEPDDRVDVELPKNFMGKICVSHWFTPVRGLLIKPVNE